MTYHDWPLVEVCKEVTLQLFSQFIGKSSTTIDSECDWQRLLEYVNEGVPLPFRHNVLSLIVLFKVSIRHVTCRARARCGAS